MAASEKDFIVAIELGSSKISGVAGKRNNDGTMQILAYATEKVTAPCIKRGLVYNIDKTTQSISNIIAKLQTTLKAKILKVYVGIGGQSVRSYKCVVKRNLLTKTYITGEIIDSIRDESYDIPYADCEVLENFPQEYTIDQNAVTEPVGVMGLNVEGEFLDIIARNTVKANIHNCFANADIEIADDLLAPCQLANNVLTDTEKRSGCALIDLGAGTTTVIVFKNNIVRHLATIPLGQHNVTQDLKDIFQLEDAEAEEIKIKYANANFNDKEKSDDEKATEVYTTSDGRTIEVEDIQNVIDARVSEILENVKMQIINSAYGDKLLAGIIITGGGANMKDMDKAFTSNMKINKIRIAKSITPSAIINGTQTGLRADNAMNNTLISLLLAGNTNCSGEDFSGITSIFDQQIKEDELKKKKAEAEAALNAENEAVKTIGATVEAMRTHINSLTAMAKSLDENRKDKKLRNKAEELCAQTPGTITSEYADSIKSLEDKDKYKITIKEAVDLENILKNENASLLKLIAQVKSENSVGSRLKNWLSELMDDES
jgi:cell division protein FtsA